MRWQAGDFPFSDQDCHDPSPAWTAVVLPRTVFASQATGAVGWAPQSLPVARLWPGAWWAWAGGSLVPPPQPPPVPQVAVGPPYTCCPSRLPRAALPLPSNRGSAAWPPALCSRLRSRLSCCPGDPPVWGSAVPPGSLKAAVGSLVAYSLLRSPGPGTGLLDHVGHSAWCTVGARVHLWNWAESSWVPVPAWGLHGRTGQ